MSAHQLSFSRTVDRALVHRRAVSEVFLTDTLREAADTVLVAAQLPLSHAYFLDSTAPGNRYGALLLTECCRQACTYVAHTAYGVPRDWVILSAGTSLDLVDTEALRLGDTPAELVMSVRTEPEYRSGRLRATRMEVVLRMGGVRVGGTVSEGRYLTREEYELFRRGARSGPAPTSADLAEPVGHRPVPCAFVGRRDPRNVLVADSHRTEHGVRVALAVPGRHPTIFEHPLDHYPGMALLDAATQAATLAVGLEHGRPTPLQVRSVRADFARFAELDSDITLTAALVDRDRNREPDPDLVGDGEATAVSARVTAVQDGHRIADVTLRSTVGGHEAVHAGEVAVA